MLDLVGYVVIEISLSFYNPKKFDKAVIQYEPGAVIKTHGAIFETLEACNSSLTDAIIDLRYHKISITPEHHFDRALEGFVDSRVAEGWRHENGKNIFQCIPIYDSDERLLLR